MRHASILAMAVVLAALALACPAAAAPESVVAAVSGGPADATIGSLRLSTGRLAVSGLATAPLTVQVGYRQTSSETFPPQPARVVLYPAGQTGPPIDPARLAPTAALISVVVSPSSGTATDGVWSGTTRIPSSAHGRWRVGCVMVAVRSPTPGGVCLTPPANRRPTLDVVGTHRPALKVHVSPTVVPYSPHRVTVTGRLVDSATAGPYRSPATTSVTVSLGPLCVAEGDCSLDASRSGAFTAADGRFRAVVATDQRSPVCVTLPIAGTHPADNQAPFFGRVCRSIVHTIRLRATSTPSTIRLNHDITVKGRVLPAPQGLIPSAAADAVVQLQRHSDGAWRTIGQARVRADGTCTVRAPAASRRGTPGLHRYRLVLNATRRTTRATSPTLIMTVARN